MELLPLRLGNTNVLGKIGGENRVTTIQGGGLYYKCNESLIESYGGSVGGGGRGSGFRNKK